MSKYIYLVPLFPLIGFLINGLFRKSIPKTMAGLIGKKVRQFRNILTSLRKKDKVFQQRRGDHKTAKLYTRVRVEGNVVVKSYKRD